MGTLIAQRIALYYRLVRLDKPIGILLLLWPTLVALWIAAQGHPTWHHLLVFGLGTVLMRSAGCAINDYADRDFDKHVKRTEGRVLTAGLIQPKEALLVGAGLALLAFMLVLTLNRSTIFMSFAALAVAFSYPYFKRFFAIPQAYLGIAFGFGIPMAFTATQDHIPMLAWVLLVANVFWAVAYDTAYAMVDRDDDIRIGIKTSALTFGRFDVAAIMLCYAIYFALLLLAGAMAGLHWPYWLGLGVAVACAWYHYTLLRERDRAQCFKAFLHNNWLGAAVFAGIVLDYLFYPVLGSIN